MAAPTPLHGTELIDCAQASAKQGILVAAHQYGYHHDIDTFQHELTGALAQMGIKNKGFEDLLKTIVLEPKSGIEVAPDPATSSMIFYNLPREEQRLYLGDRPKPESIIAVIKD